MNISNFIFYDNPIAIIIFHPSGLIELCNPSASELFGGLSKKIDCNNIDQLFQYPLLPQLQNLLLGNESTITLQAFGLRSGTNPFFCQVFVSSFIDEEGIKKFSASVVPQLFTNTSTLVPSEADIIFEQTDSSLILTDTNFLVTKINSSARAEIKELIGVDINVGSNILEVSTENDKERLLQILQSVLNGNKRNEIITHNYNGVHSECEVNFKPIKNNADQVTRILITSTNVTKQKETEIRLKDAEQHWRFALEGSGQGVWDWNIETGEVAYSKGWKRILGFSEDEVLNTQAEWERRLHPDDKAIMQGHINSHLENEQDYYESEYRLRAKDNTYRWIMSRGMIVTYDEDHKPLRMIGTHTDITQRKLIEEKYKLLFKESPLPMWVYDKKTFKFLEVNNTAVNRYGYTKNEFLNMTLFNLWLCEDIAYNQKLINGIQNVKDFHFPVVRHKIKNGDIIYVKVTGRILESHSNKQALVLAEDITEKILTENKLKKSEEQYRLLFKNNPLPSMIYDLETLNILEVNAAMVEHYGYDREELIDNSILNLHYKDDYNKVIDTIQINRNQQQIFTANWRHLKKNGEEIIIDSNSNIIEYNGYNARLVILMDVTAKVKAEQELKISNERYLYATKATSDVIWDWNINDNQILFTDNFTSLLGWELPENKALSIDKIIELTNKKDLQKVYSSINNAIYNNEVNIWCEYFQLQKNDGAFAFVKVTGQIIRDDLKNPIRIIGAVQDITDLKLKEKDLLESNERFELATKATSDLIYDWEIGGKFIRWSREILDLFGWSRDLEKFDVWEKHIHIEDRVRVLESLNKYIAVTSKNIWKEEYRLKKLDGSYAYVIDKAFIVRNEDGSARKVIGAVQNITELKFQQRLQDLELKVFEKSAQPNAEFINVLQSLVEGFEEMHDDLFFSICMPDSEKEMEFVVSRLKEKHTNSLQQSMERQFTLLLQKPANNDLFITHSTKDSTWIFPQDVTSYYNLKNVWSVPVNHHSGVLLALFSIYSKNEFVLTDQMHNTLLRIRNLLRVLVVNYLSIDQIRVSNERFDNVLKATHDLIWDWNLESGMFYRNAEGLRRVYGVKDAHSIVRVYDWMERIHPADHKKVQRVINNILHAKTEDTFDVEYRFRNDEGTYYDIYDRGIIVRSKDGKAKRLIGAAQNITQRKILEHKLLQQELDRQKLISQATIDTQEQERSLIGKELHDNVNQVLTTTKLYLDLSLSSPDIKDDLINKSSKNIIYVINEIRQLSRSLMDPSIGDLGLLDSISDLSESINLTKKVTVKVIADKKVDDVLNDSQKLMVFRIIQECLNNIVKYAQAQTVIININKEDDSIKMKIADDGIGFMPNTIKKGIGLKNIQNRVYLANGNLLVETAPDKGCKIMITFPITSETNKLWKK